MTKLRITQKKSGIGYSIEQKATLKALGLRRINHSVVHADSPTIRGMIIKIRHLLFVEEAK